MKVDIDRTEIVTSDTLIGNVVLFHPETAELLFGIGLHCLGCPSSGIETVREAAEAHGIEVSRLVEELNKIINKELI